MRGGAGEDRLLGGPGRDWLVSEFGDDVAYGQGGGETCSKSRRKAPTMSTSEDPDSTTSPDHEVLGGPLSSI